jgi:hypothetical protein
MTTDRLTIEHERAVADTRRVQGVIGARRVTPRNESPLQFQAQRDPQKGAWGL